MENNIKELKTKLKYYRKERFKELFKDGSIPLLALYPFATGVVSGMPFAAKNGSSEAIMLAIAGGATLGLAIGTAHFCSKLPYALYTSDIKLVKEEIKNLKTCNPIKQKKLK